jgi:hypothetical protein
LPLDGDDDELQAEPVMDDDDPHLLPVVHVSMSRTSLQTNRKALIDSFVYAPDDMVYGRIALSHGLLPARISKVQALEVILGHKSRSTNMRVRADFPEDLSTSSGQIERTCDERMWRRIWRPSGRRFRDPSLKPGPTMKFSF